MCESAALCSFCKYYKTVCKVVYVCARLPFTPPPLLFFLFRKPGQGKICVSKENENDKHSKMQIQIQKLALSWWNPTNIDNAFLKQAE